MIVSAETSAVVTVQLPSPLSVPALKTHPEGTPERVTVTSPTASAGLVSARLIGEPAMPAGKFPGDPEWDDYVARWKENNDRWLRTTVARHGPEGPTIEYLPVDTSVLPPETPRDYR